jgi:hypothetical protein|tara:strand:+ start:2928 stop:3221 length:294 start_codon:yes stop_codon:yes gene_type:complete
MTQLSVNWEAIGVLLTIALAVLASIGWLAKLFWGWKQTAMAVRQEKMVKAILESEFGERMNTIEVDVKNSATKNMEMSQAFHSEINKILHLLTERDS